MNGERGRIHAVHAGGEGTERPSPAIAPAAGVCGRNQRRCAVAAAGRWPRSHLRRPGVPHTLRLARCALAAQAVHRCPGRVADRYRRRAVAQRVRHRRAGLRRIERWRPRHLPAGAARCADLDGKTPQYACVPRQDGAGDRRTADCRMAAGQHHHRRHVCLRNRSGLGRASLSGARTDHAAQ